MKRRRFLHILAATQPTALLAKEESPAWHWKGVLFGADASLTLHGMSAKEGECVTSGAFQRLRKLESLFSLYQENSVIRELNCQGELKHAPPEFLSLLKRAILLGDRTKGAFDITVQPLWELYQSHYEKSGRAPSEDAEKEALVKVDYRAIQIDGDRVRFAKPGMAITLNGIAQGFITDQIAEWLKRQGVQHSLVSLGEYRALGDHPEGRPWEIGIRDPNNVEEGMDSVPIDDQALAVSGGYGYTFGDSRKHHHLFHPRGGSHQLANRSVAIIAPTATQADALSTACAVLGDRAARALAEQEKVSLSIFGVS
ncbi:MAG: thiamine biosynthesis lipoprotein [Verrucomicrobiales bacterium]|jgi:thiamine biosynthesis lipoprotein